MGNVRKILATTALLLAFSFTAHARDGWMGTGAKPTPTPEPPSVTTTSEPDAAQRAATDEGGGVLEVAFDLSFSILLNALAVL